ncbi:MAG: hypothetical protein ACFN29_04315 [Veillonella sp.]
MLKPLADRVLIRLEAKENSKSKWVLANQVGTGPIEKKELY